MLLQNWIKRGYGFYLKSPLLTTWLSYFTKLISPLLLIPLLLVNYIAEDISVFYIYLSIWSLVLVFDAGFGSTFTRLLSFEFNDKKNVFNVENVFSIVHTMKKFYLKIFFICFFILTCGFTFFMGNIINQSIDIKTGWICWAFFVCTYPFLIYGNVYSNYLQGMHQIPKLRNGEIVFVFISLVIGVILAEMSISIHFIILNLQLFLLLNTFYNKYLFNKLTIDFKGFPIGNLINNFQKKAVSNALKSGIGLLTNLGLTQVILFIYTLRFDSATLAPYLFSL